jgi:hypothetical protein
MLMEPAGLMMRPTGTWGYLKRSRNFTEENEMGSDREIRQINREPEFYEAEFCRKTGSDDDETFTYEGISCGGDKDPETGCAHPWFEKNVGQMIAGNLVAFGVKLIFDQATDAFYYTDKAGEVHTFIGEDVEVCMSPGMFPGEKRHVYPIGWGVSDGMFAWAEILKDWIYVTRAICPYCGYETDEARNECEDCGREVDF